MPAPPVHDSPARSLASASAGRDGWHHDIVRGASAQRDSPMTGGSKVLPDRIDGWKSIGAHFGRDRTTAIRWARERDLPVHRIPGGKPATVYALRHELDCWAQGGGREAALAVPVRRRWTAIAAALVGLGVIGGGWGAGAGGGPPAAAETRTALALPSDPAVADLFLKGRDLLADREAAAI